MAPSPSPDVATRLAPDEAAVLLEVVEVTVTEAVAGRRLPPPELHSLPEALHRPSGCFVTLEVAGELNGCIGTIESDEPLAHAACRLSLSAAFADPRLPPLRPDDLPDLEIHVSVLSALQSMGVASRAELHAAVRPGIDGVVLEHGRRTGLFLPSVWEQLPDRDDFLDQL